MLPLMSFVVVVLEITEFHLWQFLEQLSDLRQCQWMPPDSPFQDLPNSALALALDRVLHPRTLPTLPLSASPVLKIPLSTIQMAQMTPW
jgi:hypothetical protein